MNTGLRVIVNGVIPGWWPVISGVLQDFILRPVLFSIFINDLYAGLEGITFADNTKLGGVADMPVGCAATQRDSLSLLNLMKFKREK